MTEKQLGRGSGPVLSVAVLGRGSEGPVLFQEFVVRQVLMVSKHVCLSSEDNRPSVSFRFGLGHYFSQSHHGERLSSGRDPICQRGRNGSVPSSGV